MPTTYSDQFFFIDPYAPPPSGTVLNFTVFTLTDQDDDGDVGTAGNDRINGIDITSTYNGDTITVDLPSGGVVTIVGVTFYLANGQRVFTPKDGSILENGSTFVSSTWVGPNTQMPVTDLGPACFTPGILIDTADGPRPVETLEEGCLVVTRDHGLQPLRWIARRTTDGTGSHAPIRLCKGAIGNDRDMIVSPQHRFVIEGWRAELFFGQDEVLVAAKHLVNGDTIHVHKVDQVEYLHLVFDAHEIVFAEGCATESFDIGGDLALYDPDIRAGIAAHIGASRFRATARPVARAHEALAMLI